MIPAPFRHLPVDSVDEAIRALMEHGDEAKLLAGGHSLLPIMKLRLATPSVLVDLGRVSGLAGVSIDANRLVIGAMTRHRDVMRSPLVQAHAPLLAHASSLVGDPQVRNRGTIGGSLVHADPAADLPCAALALDVELVAQGPSGRRTIGIDSFFTGFWSTALTPDELLVEIRVPIATSGTPPSPWSYQKFTTRSQDWATVAVALSGSRIALASMAETPIRAADAEAALIAGADDANVSALADAGTSPPSDLRGSSDYRANLARVLTARALAESKARSAGG